MPDTILLAQLDTDSLNFATLAYISMKSTLEMTCTVALVQVEKKYNMLK